MPSQIITGLTKNNAFSKLRDKLEVANRAHVVLASRIQKSGTGDNDFVKWAGPVKVDHLQRWSEIFRSDRFEIVRSI